MQQRGGGATTTTTTEESSASSSSIESNNDNILKGGCNNDNNDDKDEDNTDEDERNKLILIHTYNCTTVSLMGLGMPRRQFATWVRYYLSNSSSSSSSNDILSSTTKTAVAAAEIEEIVSKVSTQQVKWENDWENHVMTLRQYWKDGKLLCEHTNLLNDRGGMSRSKNRKKQEKEQEGKEGSDNMSGSDTEEEIDDEEERQMKYEHFRNILGSYADRLVHIVEDELSDASFIPHDAAEITNVCSSSTTGVKMMTSELLLPRWNTRLGLRGWIENEYGVENTHALMANELLVKSEREQLETFQLFLDWFRGKFPYFHDACDTCGASCKDAPLSEGDDDEIVDFTNGDIIGSNNVQEETDIEMESCQHEDDKDNDYFSFVGYIGPSSGERLGNASRTELYRCRSCSAFTRFPRYNKALWVTQTRRGRCGEYSMLLYRMLRSLGYEKIRWVVDWADHVWVEVLLGDGVKSKSDATEEIGIGRWVHLDPCEAAVDNPLLYSSWGKNQTYLMAFYDPYAMMASTSDGKDSSIQPVEDVTLRYTNDEIDVVTERRGIPEQSVAEAVKEVSCKMVSKLKDVVAPVVLPRSLLASSMIVAVAPRETGAVQTCTTKASCLSQSTIYSLFLLLSMHYHLHFADFAVSTLKYDVRAYTTYGDQPVLYPAGPITGVLGAPPGLSSPFSTDPRV
eukprot:scaffold14661_cov207-Skeletonema_marinoi.AAC.2